MEKKWRRKLEKKQLRKFTLFMWFEQESFQQLIRTDNKQHILLSSLNPPKECCLLWKFSASQLSTYIKTRLGSEESKKIWFQKCPTFLVAQFEAQSLTQKQDLICECQSWIGTSLLRLKLWLHIVNKCFCYYTIGLTTPLTVPPQDHLILCDTTIYVD